MTWLVAIAAIGVLIIVHEMGHYFVAKWCGMRVERFSIGFGPAILSWRRSGTLFQLAPIPFGGFVEIRGMNIAEDVDPDDTHAYPNRPAWQRFLTIFAGPGTNYLAAFLLGFVLFAAAGVESGNTWWVVTGVDNNFDAHGKLEVGDRIVSLTKPGGETPIPIYQRQQQEQAQPAADLPSLVHESQGQPITLAVIRDGKELAFEIRAQQDPDKEWLDSGEKQFRLGISLATQAERVDVGVLAAVKYAVYFPVDQTKESLGDLYKIITGEREADLIGPVGIANVVQQAVEVGWIRALTLLVLLNVLLGLFNLLPMPALDGGRLVFLIYEMATRRRANPKIEATVHMVGIMFLLLVMVVVTVKDCGQLNW